MMLTPFLLTALWATSILGLEVTNNSLCISDCDGPSLTYSTDLVCSDDAYNTTSAGRTMRDCLICESASTANNGDNSTPQNNDIYWFLFNMKYTLQYCLFDSKTNESTPSLPECEADCAGLYPVLMDSWFGPTASKQYEYCTSNDTAFTQYSSPCATCLQKSAGSIVLGNFLNAMQSACDHRPDASLGETVPLERAVFDVQLDSTASATATSTETSSTTSISGQTSSATQRVTQGSAATSATSSPSSTLVASTSKTDSGMSTGAAAGIGVACGALGLIAIAAVAWFILRRRRRRNQHPRANDELLYAKEDYRSPASSHSSPPYYQQAPHSGGPVYAQMAASTPVHEIDSQRPDTSFRSELDSTPVR